MSTPQKLHQPTQFYYGLNGFFHLLTMATSICNKLGNGRNNVADKMLIETSAVETQCGTYKDPTPNGAGFGLTQFDQIGFDDTVTRTRAKDKQIVKECYGYDLDKITIDDLNDDAFLALILTRLKYKLIPEEIPTNYIDRAIYWKRYWNTSAGKGTPEHYINSVERWQPF